LEGADSFYYDKFPKSSETNHLSEPRLSYTLIVNIESLERVNKEGAKNIDDRFNLENKKLNVTPSAYPILF